MPFLPQIPSKFNTQGPKLDCSCSLRGIHVKLAGLEGKFTAFLPFHHPQEMGTTEFELAPHPRFIAITAQAEFLRLISIKKKLPDRAYFGSVSKRFLQFNHFKTQTFGPLTKSEDKIQIRKHNQSPQRAFVAVECIPPIPRLWTGRLQGWRLS